MDDKVIPHLVARFLSWKLPPDFCPDAGISFAPEYNNGTPEGGRHEPSGTNLLNAEQALAMFRHVLDHPAVNAALPSHELLRDALEALEPFASEGALWHDSTTTPAEDEPLWVSSYENRRSPDEAKFTLGHLRRARATAEKIRAELEVG